MKRAIKMLVAFCLVVAVALSIQVTSATAGPMPSSFLLKLGSEPQMVRFEPSTTEFRAFYTNITPFAEIGRVAVKVFDGPRSCPQNSPTVIPPGEMVSEVYDCLGAPIPAAVFENVSRADLSVYISAR
ncbi:MAG: hypothetical protein J7647_05700 [Cyanobacteria bacterium SBLK]|nr:hypothetical protein [Cyanobacteria bacterium SBLK]